MQGKSYYILCSSIFLSLVLIISCEKEEGTGGSSSISGKVKVREYNDNFTYLEETYYGPDEDVFIIYGNDEMYSDKISTNYDGSFKFEYLREGNYKIFIYSKDSANYPTKKEIPVFREVEIKSRNKDYKVEDLIMLK